MKKIINILFLFSSLLMLTACQKGEESSLKTSSSSTISSKNKTESQTSDKTSSSGNDSSTSSSKPDIEEISAEDFKKKLKNKDCESEIVFFKTPGSKESDDGLKSFSKKCPKIVKKIYTVDMTTKTGKEVVKKYNRIAKPYDAIMIKSGAPLYLDIKNDPNLPTKAIEAMVISRD